jgi:hypothetical protein
MAIHSLVPVVMMVVVTVEPRRGTEMRAQAPELTASIIRTQPHQSPDQAITIEDQPMRPQATNSNIGTVAIGNTMIEEILGIANAVSIKLSQRLSLHIPRRLRPGTYFMGLYYMSVYRPSQHKLGCLHS